MTQLGDLPTKNGEISNTHSDTLGEGSFNGFIICTFDRDIED
jgi:hypothetical protein